MTTLDLDKLEALAQAACRSGGQSIGLSVNGIDHDFARDLCAFWETCDARTVLALIARVREGDRDAALCALVGYGWAVACASEQSLLEMGAADPAGIASIGGRLMRAFVGDLPAPADLIDGATP